MATATVSNNTSTSYPPASPQWARALAYAIWLRSESSSAACAADRRSPAARRGGATNESARSESVRSSPIMPMNWRITPSPPERAIAPIGAARSPATIRSNVVLPAPFGPTSATLAPSPTRNATSASNSRPSGST
jgi:hypothetical protein